jgi:hypothetical protein
MREQEVRNLWEAYLEVCENQQLDEVSNANLNEGRTTSLSALSRESQKRKDDKKRGRPETESETHSRLAMGKFRPGASQEERAEGGRQVLKDRGKVPKKGGKDMFEHILDHLVAEGYADTNEAALVIMANMSEEWREDIMEISRKTATSAYAKSATGEFEGADSDRDIKRTNNLGKHIERKFGKKAAEDADRHADSETFGRKDPRTGKRQERPKSRIEKNRTYRTTKAGKMHGQDQAKLKSDLEKRRNVNDSYEYDTFDTILEYLVSEGYADTNESALVIMANMSEEWRQSIVEGGFNSSGRYDVGGGRTVGPVAGAVRSLFSGNLPKGQTYVPPSPQRGTNRPPAVPSSKDDSGKLTDFGAGGGKAKLKTGMSVGQVERQGRMNKGDYSG